MGGFLYQTPAVQLMLILYSFAVGVSIGIVYSVFNTISIMFGLHMVNCDEKNQAILQNIKKFVSYQIPLLFNAVA